MLTKEFRMQKYLAVPVNYYKLYKYTYVHICVPKCILNTHYLCVYEMISNLMNTKLITKTLQKSAVY